MLRAVSCVQTHSLLGASGLLVSAAGLIAAVFPSFTSPASSPTVELDLGPVIPYVDGAEFIADEDLESATLRLKELTDRAGPIPDDDGELLSFVGLAFDDVALLPSVEGVEDEYIYVYKLFEGVWVEVCEKKRSLRLDDGDLPEPLRLNLSWTMPL